MRLYLWIRLCFGYSYQILNILRCILLAYKTDDYKDETISYLVAEPSIVCDDGNETYSGLYRTFWFFFVLWSVLTPILFVILLVMIRQAVRNRRITPLANGMFSSFAYSCHHLNTLSEYCSLFLSIRNIKACRFLWGDYTEAMMFWDILETIRKIFLSGYIMVC